MDYASDRYTIVRDQIPAEIWKEMGGKLTKAGEEELKVDEAKHNDTKLKKYENVPDDLNPRFMFSVTPTQLLCEALKGDFDILYLVRRELANRGVDENGLWVGFDKAAKIHGVK